MKGIQTEPRISRGIVIGFLAGIVLLAIVGGYWVAKVDVPKQCDPQAQLDQLVDKTRASTPAGATEFRIEKYRYGTRGNDDSSPPSVVRSLRNTDVRSVLDVYRADGWKENEFVSDSLVRNDLVMFATRLGPEEVAVDVQGIPEC